MSTKSKSATYQVLANKNFRNFILSRFFITFAVQMQMTSIGLQVYYEHSKNELILGLIGLSEAIPFILTSFLSGYVADRYNRQKIIFFGIIGLLVGTILLYALCFNIFNLIRSFSYFPLLAVVVFFGIVRSFLASSMPSFMSQLVPRHLYTVSATWNSSVWHGGAILGPVAGAWLYSIELNAGNSYLINGICFLIGLLAISRIKHSNPIAIEKIKEPLLNSLKVGIQFVVKNKMLLSALSLDLFAVLFGGAVAILPAFNDKILHAGPETFGWLRTAPAIGAVLMAFVLAVWPPAKRAGLALLVSVIAFGVFTILFAISTTFWIAFIALFFTGAFDNISVVVRHSILQLMTPDNMRGRVSAVNSIFIGSSNEIGAFESGLAARIFGLVPSIIFGGVMVVIVVFSINKLNPELKNLDLRNHE